MEFSANAIEISPILVFPVKKNNRRNLLKVTYEIEKRSNNIKRRLIIFISYKKVKNYGSQLYNLLQCHFERQEMSGFGEIYENTRDLNQKR